MNQKVVLSHVTRTRPVMRKLALAAAVISLAACSKTDTPATDTAAAPPAAATPAPLTNADLDGTWEAEGMPMDRDTVVVRFTMNNTDTGEGTSVVFPSGEKVVSTRRQISGDSVVSESGAFKSQVRRGQQVTRRAWCCDSGTASSPASRPRSTRTGTRRASGSRPRKGPSCRFRVGRAQLGGTRPQHKERGCSIDRIILAGQALGTFTEREQHVQKQPEKVRLQSRRKPVRQP